MIQFGIGGAPDGVKLDSDTSLRGIRSFSYSHFFILVLIFHPVSTLDQTYWTLGASGQSLACGSLPRSVNALSINDYNKNAPEWIMGTDCEKRESFLSLKNRWIDLNTVESPSLFHAYPIAQYLSKKEERSFARAPSLSGTPTLEEAHPWDFSTRSCYIYPAHHVMDRGLVSNGHAVMLSHSTHTVPQYSGELLHHVLILMARGKQDADFQQGLWRNISIHTSDSSNTFVHLSIKWFSALQLT